MRMPRDLNPSRRQFLSTLGAGFGGVALAQLLGQTHAFADGIAKPRPEFNGGLHHPAKVKRIIQVFMNGGVAQMDSFDYKPKLNELNGKVFDPGSHVEAATSAPGKVLQSPFSFKQYGQSGRWVSEVFPHLAGCVDDIAFFMGMVSKTNVHGPASYMMNSGFLTPGFPSMGAWISYGLGSLSDNLPSFVVMPDPRGLPYNNKGNFSSGFLSVTHQGTLLNPSAATPIPDLFPSPKETSATKASESEGLALLNDMNRTYAREREGDAVLDARIASYELAARMQMSAPEALDLSKESDATRNLYGMDEKHSGDFGRRCLTARRLVERGVRFVQVWSGAGGPKNNWDNHNNIKTELPPMAAATDKPIAGLLKDLKARGMFNDTLLIFSTEFGRMPFAQDSLGRDHNGGAFCSWIAGAGVKPGVSYGATDEWGWKSVENKTYSYDFHATVLHLLGIDHERLSFRINGIDRRLTDVHGHVIKEVLV